MKDRHTQLKTKKAAVNLERTESLQDHILQSEKAVVDPAVPVTGGRMTIYQEIQFAARSYSPVV